MQYKNFRSNPMRSRNGRPTSGHCVECGRLTNESMGGKRVTTPAQRNGVWVCSEHRGARNLHSYYDALPEPDRLRPTMKKRYSEPFRASDFFRRSHMTFP